MEQANKNKGPLAGVRVIELGGIGPGPYACMLLADLGAEVIRVERASTPFSMSMINNPHLRNRRSIALNFKSPEAVEIVLKLFETADASTEGFRPGVAERLGLGPEIALKRNPKLVYGRMTGWGQDGPLAQAPGHDINYIALTGALHAIGPTGGKPVPPLNLVGDFGGGSLFLAFGIVSAILNARQTGQGQVVDAAMVDGATSLMSAYLTYREMGIMDNGLAGTSALGGAAHYYDTYETKDGKYVSIGAIEPQFYRDLIDRLDLDEDVFGKAGAKIHPGAKHDPRWPELKAILADKFKTKTRDEWTAALQDSDICFAPVLTLSEAQTHPHNTARNAYIPVGDHMQNAPAPRFSATPAAAPVPAGKAGEDNRAVLAELGISDAEFDALKDKGVVT